MLPSFILSLREGLEAALIIGIVIGALKKFHHDKLIPTVWLGAGSAAVLSLIGAVALSALGASFEGRAEEIFEGTAMFLAAGVLTWMIFWMHRQARSIKPELETGVRRAVLQNGATALFILAFTSVLREGIELALFLTATTFSSNGTQVLGGALLGLIASAVLGWGLFSSVIRLDLRRFFLVTGVLLILFAAGLVAHGVHEFNEAGLIPSVVEHVWDVNHLLPEDSTAGQILTALFGYNSNPSLTEVIAYGLYYAVLGLLAFFWNRKLVDTTVRSVD